MFEIEIFNLTIYQIIFFFFIYSFLGWIIDCIGNVIYHKKFVNSGFLNGPFCPIYGVGVLLLIILIKDTDSIITLFVNAVIVTTILEYGTGAIMEKIFKTRWWDYSNYKYNINGRICLQISLIWGIFSIFLLKFIHPLIGNVVDYIPINIGIIILIVLIIYFIIDFTFAIISSFNLKKAVWDIQKQVKGAKDTLLYRYHYKRDGLIRRLIKSFPSMRLPNFEEEFNRLKRNLLYSKKKKNDK